MAATYTVQRATTIKAPPQAIFDRIVHFKQWPEWSPWEDLDPDMDQHYGGAPDGEVGSSYSWSGNRKAGEGSMVITDVESPTAIKADLQFLKPFKSESELAWTLEQVGDATNVTWTMVAEHRVMSRVMNVFGLMEKMVGRDFEKGLRSLKTLVEGSPESS